MKRSGIALIAVITLLTLLVICIVPSMAADYEYGDVGIVTPDTYYPSEDGTVITPGYGDMEGDTEYEEETVYVIFDEMNITYYEDEVYSMSVSASGAPVSSFILEFELPYFVDIQNIYVSEKLMSAENALSETNFRGNYASVGYTSAQEFYDMTLFTVDFKINTRGNRSGNIYYNNVEFVSIEAKDLYVNTLGGHFEVIDKSLIMGDVDLDGRVALDDVMYLLRYIVGGSYELEFGELNRMVADIDRNGYLDMRDCQYIQNYLVGKLGSLDDVTSECDHHGRYETGSSEPTCSRDGYINFHCPDCGESFTETIPATGEHKYASNGYCRYCKQYNEKYDQSANCKHENKYEDYVYEPNCSREGYIEYYCPDCGEYFTETLPKNDDHDYGSDGYCPDCGNFDESFICEHTEAPESLETLEPTCVTDGKTFYYCEKCCEEITVEILPATGIHDYNSNGECRDCDHVCAHEALKFIESREPTCIYSGYTSYGCDECGYVSTTLIDALGHQFGEDGVCGECGLRSEDEKSIAYVTRFYGETDMTLYTDGTALTYWSDNGETAYGYWMQSGNRIYVGFDGLTIAVLSVNNETKEVELLNVGMYLFGPFADGKSIMYYFDGDLVLNSNGVIMSSLYYKTVRGTCEELVKNSHYIMTIDNFVIEMLIVSRENGQLTSKIISFGLIDAPCAHEKCTVHESTEPTCGTEGKQILICEDCNIEIEVFLPATGEHSYNDNGLCEVCKDCLHNNAVRDEYAGYEPECEYDGWYVYDCPTCGERFGVNIPATGIHEYTCKGECNGCGIYSEEHVGVHSYNKEGYCVWCGEHDGVTVPCEHDNAYETGRIESTCMSGGGVDYHCPDCGVDFGIRSPATVPHKTDEYGNCVWCGAYIEEGRECEHEYDYYGSCVHCGEYNADYDMSANEEAYIMYVYTAYDATGVEFYSDSTVRASFYNADGTFGYINGKWDMSADGFVYCWLDDAEYRFKVETDYTAEAPGTLVLVENDSEGGEVEGECTHFNTSVSYEKSATCVSDGYTEYYCNDCGIYFTESTPATGKHTYSSNGYCRYCKQYNEKYDQTLTECKHEYDENGVCVSCGEYNADYDYSGSETECYHPNLTEQGWCPDCSYQCDHSKMIEASTEPTCTENGKTVYSCANCNYYYEVSTGSTGKHMYDNNLTCVWCGVALEHGYTEEELENMPLYVFTNDDGSTIELYSNGLAKSVIITADGSKMENTGKWNVTADGVISCHINDGLYEFVIDNASESLNGYTQIVIIKVVRGDDEFTDKPTDEPTDSVCEHNYTFEIWEPTCTTDGSMTHVCVLCGEMQSDVLPATGVHSYEDGYCVWCGIAEGDDEGGDEADHVHSYESPDGTNEGPFVCIYCGAIYSHPNMQKYVDQNGHGKEYCPDCPYTNAF